MGIENLISVHPTSRRYEQSIDRVDECCQIDGGARGGKLDAQEVRVAGLLGRDQVDLRTSRSEIVKDSGQLDLLNAVGSDDADLPAGMAVGVVGRRYPDILDRAVFRRVEHLRAGKLGPCVCSQVRKLARQLSSLDDAVLAPENLTITQYSLLANIAGAGQLGHTVLADKLSMEGTT